MLKLEKHLENRLELIQALKEDVIGPISINENMLPLSTIGDIKLPTKDNLYKRYYQKESKQEIIQRNNPSAHYVSGMLYPYTKPTNSMNESSVGDELNLTQEEDESGETNISEEVVKKLSKSKARLEKGSENNDDDDLIPQKNEFLPSSLGLSFYIKLPEQSSITFYVRGGRYLPQTIFTLDNSQKQRWWFRSEVQAKVIVNFDELVSHNRKPFNKLVQAENINDMKLEIQILSRKLENGQFLITTSLTNRTEITSKTYDEMDKFALFQSEMEVELSKGRFLKYPRVQTGLEDDEEKSNQLLYKNAAIYGLGHNCSCDWNEEDYEIKSLKSTFLPTYETQSMTPDIKDENGKDFSVSMLELSGKFGNKVEAKSSLNKVVYSYENWISQKESTIPELDTYYQPIAKGHMEKCRMSLNRMRKGLKLLENPKVLKAFQLANQAMILQQVNGTEIRTGNVKEGSLVYDKPKETLTLDNLNELKSAGKGNWRAFQIAFILMALDSVVSGDSPEREVVDLIWFPTGGGKTEAYLGLSAFSMFYRRIMDPNDIGTDILMRYTLRLLTADQFQRSSRLICAMEHIRRKEGANLLGLEPYSIGIWLGGDTTPNTNDKALKQLTTLNLGGKTEDFIVRFCPWCGASLGKYDEHNQKKRRGIKSLYHGYKKVNKKMVIHCPDNTCEFYDDLPIYIVDEMIYEVKPTFVLGTIDKFAMLAWRPQARALFGLDENGEREVSPPNLIIQDELHLISGPLGTISGLYETVIEELCTDYRSKKPKKPKIVCATATIRRFEEQIRNLYGRTGSQLFPSSGLDFDDSFFAQTAKDEHGKNRPGRLYAGVYSPTVQLMTLQVKTFATLLQSVKLLPKEEQDPFWTLLSFYNSIRELGGGMTLTQTDIPNYFNQVRFKKAISDKELYRWINQATELTSRLKSGEVAGAIGQLKKDIKERDVIDICLASNIIEVGVDIDRLSLMTIVGQPKTTAQYIQVSGRVGRRWWERPGLIVSLFANGRSRDKSHFEHFREYHEQLYAQVEPTSVTPFSDPSIKKVLPAIIIIYLRQMLDAQIANSPETISEYASELESFKQRLLKRVELIDPMQKDVVQTEFDRFVRRLNSGFIIWEKKDDDLNIGVMYLAGSYVSDEQKRLGTPVLMSMRSVDAQCVGTISSLFMDIEDQGDDF
ncbi:helicase-related protein [Priestia abyssalis]|uniref:helicase-related protein n=1 Tax=Priestia abyssalis TaxID=1221450 RepID=UPI0009952C4F|nr:helicase-related protein [Priestia abyssalis]